MKRLAVVAALLTVAACQAREEGAMSDTAAPAMAPAPADTGMGMGGDTMPMGDTMKMGDTAAKKTP
jgi:hypothetical protein